MASKLRGVDPEAIEKHAKIFLHGRAKVGKTTFSLSFPMVYFIDTERGAENDQYVDLLKKSGGKYWQTTDLSEIIEEVKALISEKHPYKTLVIDPITVPYNEELDKWAQIMGTEYSRHKAPADRMMKHLMALLVRLDMNVVITSHSKANWEKSVDGRGKETLVQNGYTFDSYLKSDYLFDIILEATKRGPDRLAVVRGSRIKTLPELHELPLAYGPFADLYGREVLEREAIPVAFSTKEQQRELERLLDMRKDGTDLLEKWLKKAGAEDSSELTTEQIEKCISFLRENKEKE